MTPAKPPKPAITLKDHGIEQMSKNERIKLESKGLFFVSDGKGDVHTFGDEVRLLTSGEKPTISGEAKELSKFFGIYKQQGRTQRGAKTQEFFFMIRLKNPAGGDFSPEQWAAIDSASDDFADGTLRITSRQSIQYHYVYGPKLAPMVRHLNRHYRRDGTLSACGDVNRNVMASPIDDLDPTHQPRGRELAFEIAEELAPKSSAYFQIWLSDEEGHKLAPVNSDEPLYGNLYLPRKFKIGIAHPLDNSIDMLSQDIGLLPVMNHGATDGSLWDLYTGGGMGMSHNNPNTAPLLGLYLGRIRRDQVVDACKAIATLQKENGDRRDRKQARWKYTLRRLGVDAVKAELRDRFEIEIEDAQPQTVPPMELHLGYHAAVGGGAYYGVSVESGRVKANLRQAVRAAIERYNVSVRLTAQQDLILRGDFPEGAIEAILDENGVARPETLSIVRKNAMACPAKPTCGLAMTDAENILPQYLDAIEQAGLGDLDAVIRMTGCPNNCARPPTAEIGIYGYGKNDHVVLVGGSRSCERVAETLYSRIPGEKMIPVLVGLFGAVRKHNAQGLPVGDFLHQTDAAQLRSWIGIEDGPDTA